MPTSLTSFTSHAALALRAALGVPETKIPIDGTAFVSYILPPLVCHIVVAVLVVTPRTRPIRVVLFPLVASLALRASLSLDASYGKQKLNDTNFVIIPQLLMFAITARTLDWTLTQGPLMRHFRPPESPPSTIMDALDLISNFRGVGWEWSGYLSYVPRDTRPTHRALFVLHTLASAAVHTLIYDVSHRAVHILAPAGVGTVSAHGSTIFDTTLPFPVGYARATLISLLAASTIYAVMQFTYDVCTAIGILFLAQHPAQWPPAFDAPWCATSLRDLWGRRWHQFFRHVFLLGGRALTPVFGKAGWIAGTFGASVAWHYVSLVDLDGEPPFWRMLTGFGMMAFGILLERAFRQMTGRRVGGFAGWAWTMLWLMVWGNVIAEGFARGGMFGCWSALERVSPLGGWVERWVMDLDGWLHTIYW